ncbi:MAG TPA: RNA methyltransferase, partial [Desulfobacterales bacterium]|nr:RNA methyltransferase [Desulfobacterales bacterium]
MKKESSGLAVVLVGPQGPRNIGAVCRVMRNFGYRDLRLVQPACNHRSLAARYAAVRSQDLLDQARVYQSLAAAVADCRLVLGTTRRFGKNRRQCVLPEDLATMT